MEATVMGYNGLQLVIMGYMGLYRVQFLCVTMTTTDCMYIGGSAGDGESPNDF